MEQCPDSVVLEVPEAEADLFDALDQVVVRFGWSVGDPNVHTQLVNVPRESTSPQSPEGLPQLQLTPLTCPSIPYPSAC